MIRLLTMTHSPAHLFEPDMIEPPIYACGDVHGRIDLLEKFLDWVSNDSSSHASVVFLGDYVDRGPNSKEVIELLMSGPYRNGHKWYPIKGNHEDMLVQARRNPGSIYEKNWLLCGGSNTLKSYGRSTDIYDVPNNHVDFIEKLPLGFDDGQRLFVHAGVSPDLSLINQKKIDLLWIREPFLSTPHIIPRLVVHGHTPDKYPFVGEWRVGLDIGAYASGQLAGARFDFVESKNRIWVSE